MLLGQPQACCLRGHSGALSRSPRFCLSHCPTLRLPGGEGKHLPPHSFVPPPRAQPWLLPMDRASLFPPILRSRGVAAHRQCLLLSLWLCARPSLGSGESSPLSARHAPAPQGPQFLLNNAPIPQPHLPACRFSVAPGFSFRTKLFRNITWM